MTERVDADLLERARSALDWVPEPPPGWSPTEAPWEYRRTDFGVGPSSTSAFRREYLGQFVSVPDPPPQHFQCRCSVEDLRVETVRTSARAGELAWVKIGPKRPPRLHR